MLMGVEMNCYASLFLVSEYVTVILTKICVIVSAVSSTTRLLLDENCQAFGQISANLSTFKVSLDAHL